MLSSSLLAQVGKWKIDTKKAEVKFIDIESSTRGTLSGLEADITFDIQNLSASKITASIDAKSVKTGMKEQEVDIMSKDYFDAEKYPKISFTSSGFELDGENFIVKGNLNLKGQDRPIIITFTFNQKGKKGVFEGKMSFNAKDFGVSTGEVKINIKVPVSQK